MAVNKVVYGNSTLIDLTGDTITADKLAQGYTAHDASGAAIVGTMSGGGSSDPTYKRWTATVANQVATNQTVTLFTDSWLASHYNDANLEIIISNLNNPNFADTTNVWFVYNRARNSALIGTYCQYGVRSGKSNNYLFSIARSISAATLATGGEIKVSSSGALSIRATASCVLSAGTYEVIARILQ